VNLTLRQQGYEQLKRSGRGLVRRYLEKMTGLSRAQTTGLITVYAGGEEVKARPYRRHRTEPLVGKSTLTGWNWARV
jgi:hypothetical protein